jgi:NAD(P)H-dependent nitrite reductase small subunit
MNLLHGFEKVARICEIPEGKSRLIHLENEQIALWRLNGRIYAINNFCPHQHIAALHQGTLEGHCVACPMHGWTFSLETGSATFGNGRAQTYDVRVEGDNVYVEKPANLW